MKWGHLKIMLQWLVKDATVLLGGITVISVTAGFVGAAIVDGPIFYLAAKTKADTALCNTLADQINSTVTTVWRHRLDPEILGLYCGPLKTNIANFNKNCPGFSVPQYSGVVPPCPP
jgi:hypothetical protein